MSYMLFAPPPPPFFIHLFLSLLSIDSTHTPNLVFQKTDSPGPGYFVNSKMSRHGSDGTPAFSMSGRVKDFKAVCECIYIYIYVCVLVCVYVYVHVCRCSVYMYACTNVLMNGWIYRRITEKDTKIRTKEVEGESKDEVLF